MTTIRSSSTFDTADTPAPPFHLGNGRTLMIDQFNRLVSQPGVCLLALIIRNFQVK